MSFFLALFKEYIKRNSTEKVISEHLEKISELLDSKLYAELSAEITCLIQFSSFKPFLVLFYQKFVQCIATYLDLDHYHSITFYVISNMISPYYYNLDIQPNETMYYIYHNSENENELKLELSNNFALLYKELYSMVNLCTKLTENTNNSKYYELTCAILNAFLILSYSRYDNDLPENFELDFISQANSSVYKIEKEIQNKPLNSINIVLFTVYLRAHCLLYFTESNYNMFSTTCLQLFFVHKNLTSEALSPDDRNSGYGINQTINPLIKLSLFELSNLSLSLAHSMLLSNQYNFGHLLIENNITSTLCNHSDNKGILLLALLLISNNGLLKEFCSIVVPMLPDRFKYLLKYVSFNNIHFDIHINSMKITITKEMIQKEVNEHSFCGILYSKIPLLIEKIQLMTLLKHIHYTPVSERVFTLSSLASIAHAYDLTETQDLPQGANDIEYLLIKLLGRKLIKGFINNVDQLLIVEIVLVTRIICNDDCKALLDQLTQWKIRTSTLVEQLRQQESNFIS